ncbi:MAG: hypothetical protein CMQ41_03865 [Gammaproteobacteria bacterium]|nr:hypothetical protein [Gammaproteobacteria bacterium]|tara:strand:- start:311 stop:787 length:477 start_codon:yes stop_codon:yes gene_type:complete
MKKITLVFLLLAVVIALPLYAQLPGIPEIDQEAPLDTAVTISKETLLAAFGQINEENIPTTRILEGGEFNVNIRHIENVTLENMRMLTHLDTIDVWIVQEGSGILNIGGELIDGILRGGKEQFIEAGDIVYIPAGLSHGVRESALITWFNIRFPEHRN